MFLLLLAATYLIVVGEVVNNDPLVGVGVFVGVLTSYNVVRKENDRRQRPPYPYVKHRRVV